MPGDNMSSPRQAFDYPGALKLDGKAFVVIGAGGGGMGTESSLALAQAGAELLLVDIDSAQANEIASATGGTAHTCDVTDRAGMQAVFARANELFGSRFHGVVDIVGIAQAGPLPSFDDSAIERQFNTVLRHALLATQIAAPMLAKNGGGTLVFVGSISGVSAIASQAVYGMAKAALHHLARYAAQEFGPSGVRANVVAPGFVQTPRLKRALPTEVWDTLAASNPLRRVAEPKDIAKAILFLASDLSSYVTGNVLTLDGGISNNVVLPDLGIGGK
jgi:NAD(P)-dependent dehydrogenase (short-subunit alcohol dehydrogenase family)